jgi:hypothetical protein
MCCYNAAAGITRNLTEHGWIAMDQAPPAHPGAAGMQRNHTEEVCQHVLLVVLDHLVYVEGLSLY